MLTGDDKKQARLAQAALADAELVALAVPALCELVWVLSQHIDLERILVAWVIPPKRKAL